MQAAVAGFLIRPNLSRRTFTITPHQMHRLKHRIIASNLSPAPPSTFVAVVALAWASFVHAKHHRAAAGTTISPSDEVHLFFFADCRSRLSPPPGDGFFGTCISGCLATLRARDILLLAGDGDGVARAAAAVAAEVRRAEGEPAAGWEWMDTVSTRADMDRLVNVAGSTRFPAYQATDFGWGPPVRTELVTMNHDGQVVLVAGKDGDGGVQASVSLHPAHMDAFKTHFLSYLG
ncbi:hypothetical protein PR202_ga30593 [Eleusine coracana subsp. coracana]|uniref:Anthocyanin 5-aromatic acyltransferase n=1 Tax=Eleusine coracana subsp. coracana TaxID=191504 RepID=A0AAV5DNT1_ELECO|nr:hypothetical protein PR202_ga30593 [Eleusine coracana subsp. coracana]